ncbi:rhombotarget A [Acinetobacter towneri]|uniref:rhombotarget A n=1 Tax=Acinetobacter towneri TaxID=202956 RepID=UPI0025784FBA|nr:rhombotarget A [Acinetobacter towneri]MDM1721157.1 rhombotarget A [Acinetobacter towneri]
MLKQSIGIGMLFIAGHAYSSNIIVTTTADTKADDQQCSLREAIEYINLGMPEEGYLGCGGKNASSVILLEKKAVYQIDTQLKITENLEIKTTYDSSLNDKTAPGLNNATIQMRGNERIFHIEDSKDRFLKVSLKELTLQGCGEERCRQQQGGLIYNNEHLILDYVKLSQGVANQGGAIYNLAQMTDEKIPAGFIEIKNSLLEANQAQEGGVIYTQFPRFVITTSVFKGNKTISVASANLYSAASLADEEIKAFPSMGNMIVSSTFTANEGYVMNVLDDIGVNNISLIGNSRGVYLNAPLGKAYIANSVILGNPHPVSVNTAANCVQAGSDATRLQNNLVGAGCGAGDSNYPNTLWTANSVLAGNLLEGACQTLSQDKTALFCPYQVPENSFLGFMRPRVLLSYNSLKDSVVLNQGQLQLGDNTVVGCAASDQRGKNRQSDITLCDRGAIEVMVPETMGLIGQDILAGQIAKMSVSDLLGDSDLVPKEFCDQVYPNNPTGQAWQAGCVQIEQLDTRSKGKLTVDELGNLVYTPDSAWHGADVFKVKLVTSTTRFNSTTPYMEVKVQVIQEHENRMESDKIKVSGGAWSAYGLMTLLGLLGLRRRKA